jgi:hypothetical protein
MSHLPLLQGLLANLKGETQERTRAYLPKAEAYLQLKFHTGQDFGEDISAWEEWIRKHPQSIRSAPDVKSRLSRIFGTPPEENTKSAEE